MELLKFVSLYDFYSPMLTERQRDVLDLYYNDDLSLSEIAFELGITRQGVRDAVKTGEARLNEFEDKLHAVEIINGLNSRLGIAMPSEKAETENMKNVSKPRR